MGETTVCRECGAVLRAGEPQCDLCGLPVAESSEPTVPDRPVISPAQHMDESSVPNTCPACNSTTAADARFCHQCGSDLKVKTPGRQGARETKAPDTAQGRRMLSAAVIGIVAVILLYGVTLWSKQMGSAPPEMTSPATTALPQAGELTGDLEARAAAIKKEIEAAPDAITELDRRQELVRFYQDAGRPDLAAEAQLPVAEELETAYGWSFLGDLYYDWMLSQDGQHAAQVARHAINAYQRSLELDPDNLDVRTHLAVTYLYDPTNPMQAVEEINRVLEKDPDHLQANYNRGIMLAQIGRTQEAAQQFRRVMELAQPGSLAYERANEALRTIGS